VSLEWHEIRGGFQVATDGEKIFAVIAKPEGAPIEMFQIQYFENCFSAIGAAMAEVERDHKEYSAAQKQRHLNQPSLIDTILPMLKQFVATYDKKPTEAA
jgi:hypothetical protein